MPARRIALLAAIALAIPAVAEEKHKLEDVNPVGKPDGFRGGLSSRYAVWYDDEGWHVRTTSGPKGPHSFPGTVEIVGGKMVSLTPVAVEGKGVKKKEADQGTWNAQHTVFKFTLSTGKGHTDGFDLKVTDSATAVKFTLTAGGDESPGKIFIGANGEHPKEVTFYLPARPKK
jgi:hypothetical protein